MKVPFSWLKELVDIDVTAQELEEKLFSCGFEVEELIPLDAGISKVVVGKIVEMEPQEGWSPKREKLKFGTESISRQNRARKRQKTTFVRRNRHRRFTTVT